MRCSAYEDGSRCDFEIKNVFSGLHQYCSERRKSLLESGFYERADWILDACHVEACTNPRVRRHGKDLKYCDEHRCTYRDCSGYKESGQYCRRHICSHRGCVSFGYGDGGERFCERHRQRLCSKLLSSRSCHVRENGSISPYCGTHYCETADCENQRQGSSCHCYAHTCMELHCVSGRASAMGQYCREHKCRRWGCESRRAGGEYCTYHKCSYEYCSVEAGSDGYCYAHRRPYEMGYGGERRPSYEAAYSPYRDGELAKSTTMISDAS